jgi:diguanylate cyclase (GGDEF)-like protein
MRVSGVAFRYGGEEFVLLMPALGAEQATRRAEDIQARIRALRIEHSGRDLGPITASFGIACAPDCCSFKKLVQTADAALYRAKDAGRDRIIIAENRRANQKVA